MKDLTVRPLERGDVAPIAAAFRDLGWDKPRSQYERYLSEQREGLRSVLVALVGGGFAGYLTINWDAGYAHFQVPASRRFRTSTYRRASGAQVSEPASWTRRS